MRQQLWFNATIDAEDMQNCMRMQSTVELVSDVARPNINCLHPKVFNSEGKQNLSLAKVKSVEKSDSSMGCSHTTKFNVEHIWYTLVWGRIIKVLKGAGS